jgi:hypothetical protein
VSGHAIRVERDGAVIESVETADPLAWIDAYQKRFKVADLACLPRFTGGWSAISATTPSAISSRVWRPAPTRISCRRRTSC